MRDRNLQIMETEEVKAQRREREREREKKGKEKEKEKERKWGVSLASTEETKNSERSKTDWPLPKLVPKPPRLLRKGKLIPPFLISQSFLLQLQSKIDLFVSEICLVLSFD